MPVREDRSLAVALVRVLDGEEAGTGEARRLAVVLSRVAETARAVVPDEAVERALASTSPRLATAPSHGHWRAAAALATGVALAVGGAASVALLVRGGGLDIESRAAAALAPARVLHVVERIEPVRPGAFPSSTRSGWLGSGGHRVIWNQFVHGRRIAATLLENGRVSRYDLTQNVIVVGPSCDAFASGCAELVDPIDLYRRALQERGAEASRTVFRGRRAYRLVLPVQALPDSTRIEQVVTIDASTYLPRVIVWREPGHPPFSRIVVTRVRSFAASAVRSVFYLNAPPGIRVVERVAPGRALREVGRREVTLDQARRAAPRLEWVGASYHGQPLTGIVHVRWNVGDGYLLRYGSALSVWNYGRVVPPEVVGDRYVPAKTIPLPRGGVIRFYLTIRGRLVGELDRVDRAVTVLGPQQGKADIFDALEALTPLG